MKIQEITVSQTKQIRQFEPRNVSITATLQDSDDPNKSLNDLVAYVDYKINQPEREDKLEKYKGIAENSESTDKDKKGAEGWLAKYYELETTMTELEFTRAAE